MDYVLVIGSWKTRKFEIESWQLVVNIDWLFPWRQNFASAKIGILRNAIVSASYPHYFE